LPLNEEFLVSYKSAMLSAVGVWSLEKVDLEQIILAEGFSKFIFHIKSFAFI